MMRQETVATANVSSRKKLQLCVEHTPLVVQAVERSLRLAHVVVLDVKQLRYVDNKDVRKRKGGS